MENRYMRLSTEKLNDREATILFELWCLESGVVPDTEFVDFEQCSHYILYEFMYKGYREAIFILKWEMAEMRGIK